MAPVPASARTSARTSAGFRSALLRAALAGAAALALTGGAARAEEERPAGRSAPAGADVLVLRDGRRLEGAVVAEDASGVTFRSGGTTRFHAADAVERVERGPVTTAPAAEPETGKPRRPPRNGNAPEPGTTPKPADGTDPPAGDRPGKDRLPRGAPLTEKASAWVAELAARATSDDEQVRRSVAAALRALGPAAVPAIRAQAASTTDPGARALLERVATEMAGRGEGAGDRPAPDGTGKGARPEGRPKGRGAMLDKIAEQLEVRDDQRPGLERLLGDLEREGQQALREVREGSLTPADASTLFTAIRERTRTAAASVLDAGQAAAFDTLLDRWLEGQKERAAKGAARPAPDKPSPDKPSDPPPGKRRERSPEKPPERSPER